MYVKGPVFYILLILCCFLTAMDSVHAGEDRAEDSSRQITLASAVMCAFIEEFAPQNPSVVFSIEVGKISCFTSFTGIKESTYTLHKWFRRDKLVTTKRLTLKPPNWATYSSIQLREADKGPWRVEILDSRKQVIKILRFSVTD